MAATAKELCALAPELLPAEADILEMQPFKLDLGKRTVIFCLSGVGPINAALSMGFCLGLTAGTDAREAARVSAVLSVGLAGAFDLGLTPLASLCLVSEEIWPEYGLNDGVSVTARAFSFPLWHREDGQKIYDRIGLDSPGVLFGGSFLGGWQDKSLEQGSCLHLGKLDFFVARSLSVAGVTASKERLNQLRAAYHADLENMEGFAIAYACARAKIPCVEIRSVSNKVGPRSAEEKDFPRALMALGRILPGLGLL